MRPGDRIVVVDGQHLGTHGRVILTAESSPRIVVKLVGVTTGQARVVLDNGWSGVLPLEALKPTRLETDEELRQRIGVTCRSLLSEAIEACGKDLDDCAKYLGLARREVDDF